MRRTIWISHQETHYSVCACVSSLSACCFDPNAVCVGRELSLDTRHIINTSSATSVLTPLTRRTRLSCGLPSFFFPRLFWWGGVDSILGISFSFFCGLSALPVFRMIQSTVSQHQRTLKALTQTRTHLPYFYGTPEASLAVVCRRLERCRRADRPAAGRVGGRVADATRRVSRVTSR